MPNYFERKSTEISEVFSQNRITVLAVSFVFCLVVWIYLAFFLSAESFTKLIAMLPSVLSGLVGIGVSVLITTFSFVFVALSLVSVQFSPRVVRHFWNGDFFRRIFLWSFIFVFGFCFIIQFFDLPKIQLLAITLAFYLIFILFPIFLSYLANNLNAASITHNIAKITVAEINQTYQSLPILETDSEVLQIKSDRTGFLANIDSARLIKIFEHLKQKNPDVKMQISPYLGSFVESSATLAEILPNIKIDKKTSKEIAKCFYLNKFRSIDQDVEYGIRQLVDIAIKAISPAVNDPTTCINCLNYIGVIIKTLAVSEEKSLKAKHLEQYNIFLREPSFEKYVDDAFNQIYQWGKADYIVVKNIIYILTDIVSIVPNENKLNVILHEIDEMELSYLFDKTVSCPISLSEQQKYLHKALKTFYSVALNQAEKLGLNDKVFEIKIIANKFDS